MTTIIIIVVVALVFFITICVVTFMVWKREAEMRTDSIKAIENNLEEMLYELTGDTASSKLRATKDKPPYENVLNDMQDMHQQINDKIKENNKGIKAVRKKSHDPFGWVKEHEPERDSDQDRRKDQPEEEALKVFKPAASEPRKLKWVEVYEEPEQDGRSLEAESITEGDSGKALEEEIEEALAINLDDPDLGLWEDMENTQIPEPEDEIQELDSTGQIEEALWEEIRQTAEEAVQNKENPFQDELLGDPMEILPDNTAQQQTGYNIGKSGKEYTVSELEALIKE